MGLSASDTPDLLDQDLPTATSPGHTLYLKIDLNITRMGGKPVDPMTAVFAPDPKKLTGGDVDVLLWFHGDKHVWSKARTAAKTGDLYLWGKSIKEYLKVDECHLREFIIQQTTKRQFLLVAPTLGDHSGRGPDRTAGGLLWQQADTEAFLQQVLNGVRSHMGVQVTGPRNIVLAAHSGGGHVMGHMAQHFTGAFDKANEVWCFDCSYWGSEPFTKWAKKGHSNSPRLWVYSTGGKGNGSTGDAAYEVLTYSQAATAGTTSIEVLVDDYPSAGKTSSTKYFVAAYKGSAGGHYESIAKYLPTLVENSKNLK